MSDDFIDKEEQNEENIPTPENGHLDYKPADTKNTGVKHQLSGMYQNWFLDYASYVILERAVPHINDGLKPVQRRILHSMKRLDDGRYNKVANIVGHTMQFHPHGDASIGWCHSRSCIEAFQRERYIWRYYHSLSKPETFCRRS